MSILKYIERLKRMDDLIFHSATGTAEEFANTLGISVSVLKENLNEMRTLGAEIEFCRTRKSYFYKSKKGLVFKFDKVLNDTDSLNVGGGKFFEDNKFTALHLLLLNY